MIKPQYIAPFAILAILTAEVSLKPASSQNMSQMGMAPYAIHTCSDLMTGEVWTEIGYGCHSDPLMRQIPRSNSIIGDSGISVTSTPMLKCDDGWSVVLSTGMQPMCAHELKEPK